MCNPIKMLAAANNTNSHSVIRTQISIVGYFLEYWGKIVLTTYFLCRTKSLPATADYYRLLKDWKKKKRTSLSPTIQQPCCTAASMSGLPEERFLSGIKPQVWHARTFLPGTRDPISVE